MKIGVYLCQCGGNISKVVDLPEVQKFIENKDDVALIKEHSNMCSGAGQKLIIEDVKANNLDKVVVSACSPKFHEKTFKSALEKAGLNPYVLEIANLREHCSWAHREEPELATEKAKDLVNSAVSKIRKDYPLEKKMVKMGKRVLVIGGGIAGIQAALDLADAGNKVIMVEKDPTIGGKMTILTKTFPTEDCAACIISPKMAAVLDNPNITLYVNSEIKNTIGHRLHFEITVEKKPTYVSEDIDMDQCLICEKCVNVCPVSVPNKWEQGIMDRKAVYIPAALAIPFTYNVDDNSCLHFKDGSCNKCAEVCPQNAIDLSQKSEFIDFTVDTIVVATGYDIIHPNEKPSFGYDLYDNVVTGLEMERIVDHISEEPPPRPVGDKVAFIQCVGSRDEQTGREYCSRVCCMYATKLASLLKQAKPEKDIYIFYTDLRAFGKGYEEYYKKAQKMGIKFVRGKVAELHQNPENKKIILRSEDTLSRQIVEGEFDLVVLSTGLKENESTEKIVNFLKLPKSSDGFIQEAHPKYKPVDTNVEGVFVAGAAQGPKDIPDTVAQASAAASRVMVALAKKEFEVDPLLAYVHQDKCDGCTQCIDACPKNAISMIDGKAFVNDAVCVGCGACIGSCPIEALDFHGYSNDQMYSGIEGMLETKKEDELRLMIFADDAGAYPTADAVGIRKMKYPIDYRITRVPSASRITEKLIISAFKKGADAIFLAETPMDSSRFPWAKETIFKTVNKVKEKLLKAGIDTSRITFAEIGSGAINIFLEKTKKLYSDVKSLDVITAEQRERL